MTGTASAQREVPGGAARGGGEGGRGGEQMEGEEMEEVSPGIMSHRHNSSCTAFILTFTLTNICLILILPITLI